MEPPVIPKPMPVFAAELPLDYTNKLFGIVYITLTEHQSSGGLLSSSLQTASSQTLESQLLGVSSLTQWLGIVATKFLDLPANVSYITKGMLNESSFDVSNSMDQSDGKLQLWALSPN
ncbi:hypothetical protein DSO57_1034700 [Entomophthora muscae]|uniref:Uncharacterized protein n=1 Tax=Entomophthora muscae TaxID=34485 RepID=A0ACC2TYT8_9FUNG|nr:hypothetical protein DSO57_1034700 [Entomophthora muscae]